MLQLPVLLLATLAAVPHGAPGDELEEALHSLRKAAVNSDIEERRGALRAVLTLADPDSAGPLAVEFSRCVAELGKAEEAARRLAAGIALRRRTIADLTLRAERDKSLLEVIHGQEKAVEKFEEDLALQRERAVLWSAWRDAMIEGVGGMFDGFSVSQRRGAEKSLWNEAEKSEDLAVQLGAVELIGAVGRDGTGVQLQKLIVQVAAMSARIERKLPKKMQDVREMEARIQRDQEAGMRGRALAASMAQYNQVKKEAALDRRTLNAAARLQDACVRAAAAALAREEGDVQRKSLQTLGRALKKAKDGARLRTLAILATLPSSPLQASLRQTLATEKEPAAIAQILADLSVLGDREIVPAIFEQYLWHESWHVQHAAVGALARLRVKEAIPLLIEGLGRVEGRPRSDMYAALVSLTGKDFRTNVALWTRWWEAEGAEFVVSAEPPPPEEPANDEPGTRGVSFFGIHTLSQRVLFVLDLSGSMDFSMVSRNNPDDDPNGEPDMPRGDEISRLTAAKRDLLKAIQGLPEGSLFNLVLYASDVWVWQDKMLAMDEEVREGVVAYVDALKAEGGTNIYGALAAALELAGAEVGDEWGEPQVDTIFLLTDGRPSVGLTNDPDEILAYVREKNAAAGIVIHTIGLSGAQDAYLLSTLAEENGGTYAAR